MQHLLKYRNYNGYDSKYDSGGIWHAYWREHDVKQEVFVQGTELAALSTPEASLRRLVSLSRLFGSVETTAKCVSWVW